MEAHEALRRHEHVASATEHGSSLAQQAAVVVAIIAGFLAIATFLSNEAVKEVITEETQAADTSARLEANDTKTTIADGNATLLKVLETTNVKQARAFQEAEALEARIKNELAPIDIKLASDIKANQQARDHADDQHFFYELSQVLLQIGIVLAGISILAKRRWLLGSGIGVAVVGVGLLIAGVLA